MSEPESPPTRRPRRWRFRLIALLLPVVLLVAAELVLRLAGVAEEAPWENPHVDFVTADRFFPHWDREIEMPKPAGLTRIFVLGGSAVLGYQMRSFPDRLREELPRRLPDRRFEVINGGMVGFGSHRVFEVLKEAAAFDPDLVLVYTGHNEFLEQIFFDPDGLLAKQEQVKRAARGLRIIRVLHGLFGGVEFPRPELPRQFFGNMNFPLIKGREQYELRLKFLAANLDQMIALAKDRGFTLVLSPAVPNLLWGVGDPVRGPGCTEEWESWFAKGEEAWFARRPDEAEACYAKAAALDDGHAGLAWNRGQALLAMGRNESGIRQLVRSVDLDRRGNRANSDVAATILDRAGAGGVTVVDLRPRLFEFVPRDFDRARRGEENGLYLDHCHFTPEGHAVAAAALADALAGQLGN
jgi:lysophospholipase L1-like esterase